MLAGLGGQMEGQRREPTRDAQGEQRDERHAQHAGVQLSGPREQRADADGPVLLPGQRRSGPGQRRRHQRSDHEARVRGREDPLGRWLAELLQHLGERVRVEPRDQLARPRARVEE